MGGGGGFHGCQRWRCPPPPARPYETFTPNPPSHCSAAGALLVRPHCAPFCGRKGKHDTGPCFHSGAHDLHNPREPPRAVRKPACARVRAQTCGRARARARARGCVGKWGQTMPSTAALPVRAGGGQTTPCRDRGRGGGMTAWAPPPEAPPPPHNRNLSSEKKKKFFSGARNWRSILGPQTFCVLGP